jgi:hypothetical protein
MRAFSALWTWSRARLGRGTVMAIVELSLMASGLPAAAAQHKAAGVPATTTSTSTLPCIPAGHGPATIPAIAFGRSGGNIRPMEVDIYGDGTIAYQGAASPLTTTYTILPLAVLGLQHLAQAEGFWSMPAVITSTHVLPDVASLFITVRAGCSTTTHTVRVRGGQSGGFMELYDTLLASVAIPVTPPSAPVPVGTPAPGTGQPTPGPGTPISGPSVVTAAYSGQTLAYTVGQSFLLSLGTGYQWTVQIDHPAVFQRKVNVLVIKGAQGIYDARTAGQATLIANGRMVCSNPQSACPALVRHFEVHLIATT